MRNHAEDRQSPPLSPATSAGLTARHFDQQATQRAAVVIKIAAHHSSDELNAALGAARRAESSQGSLSPPFAAFDLRVPSPGWAGKAGVGSAAARLTDKILGNNSDDLVDILRAIASEIGLSHISYVRFASNRSWDVSLLTAVATYSKLWQIRYFLKRYGAIDPVIKRGSAAILPFDWETLHSDEPATVNFFADALRHGVGGNGLSIPVRNRKNTHSLISFTSDIPKQEWGMFKQSNMTYLQQLSALIDSAAGIDSKPPPSPVQLSLREEQCLIWAARGKTYQEIADILSLSLGSVKTHLDTARHKLRCISLTHAVGIAVATGVIPAAALRDGSSFKD